MRGCNIETPSYNLWDMVCDSKSYDLVGVRNEFFKTMNFDKMFTFTTFSTGKMQVKNAEKSSCVIIAEAN